MSQTETESRRGISPWVVGLAIIIVLGLFLYGRLGGSSGRPIVTSITEYQETLKKAEALSAQHLIDADAGKEMNDVARKDLRQAAGLFDAMADFQPTNIALFTGAGKCYQVLGNDDAAIKRFEQGLATVPPKPIPAVEDTQIETLYLLAKSQFNQKDYADSLKSIGQAIKLYPQSPIYFTLRARIYIQQKNYPNAASDLEKAIQLDPGYTLAASLLKLIAIDASDMMTSRAKQDFNKKDYKAVVADCDKGLRIARGYVPLLALRAASNLELGHKDLARIDVDEILKYHPDDPDGLRLKKLLK
ncbi:MAG TPA: tetratricopeptide repeat protein [Fimbriimonadaceae bacterium]|nr:tetratricopeptide repeat protein [Fimbriimonadaceae bacterium]